jgi:uncharacterized protein YraI
MSFILRRFNNFLAVMVIGFALFFSAGGAPTLAAPPADPLVGPVGYVRAGQLNIRSGPGLSYGVITVVYRNDTVGLTGRTADNTWLRVRLPLTGQEGWAAAHYLEIGLGSINNLPVIDGGSPPPNPAPATAYVSVYQLNVRGGPGLSYNIIGTLRQGDSSPLIGRSADGAWLQIQVSSPYPTFAVPTGWVMARYVSSSVPIFQLPVTDGGTPPINKPIGSVTVSRLNVRGGPGFEYNVVNWLTWGMQVNLLGRTNASNWLKVEWGGYPGPALPNYTGWVAAGYIRTTVPIDDLPVIGDQPSTRRIQFQPGSSSATLWSSLTPNGLDTYVLSALAGQTMTVEVSPSRGRVLLSISGANGEVLKSAGAGSPRWSGVLPLTQDYFITISAEGGSVVNYTLQVTIPPR